MIHYLDNVATSRVLPEAAEVAVRVMCEDFGNPSSLHKMGIDAARILEDSRAAVAQALSAVLMGAGAALNGPNLLPLLPELALGLGGTYGVLMAMAVPLCLLGGYGLRGMGRTVLLFPLFMASWLPLQVFSLFRDTRTWHTVRHVGRQAAAGTRG